MPRLTTPVVYAPKQEFGLASRTMFHVLQLLGVRIRSISASGSAGSRLYVAVGVVLPDPPHSPLACLREFRRVLTTDNKFLAFDPHYVLDDEPEDMLLKLGVEVAHSLNEMIEACRTFPHPLTRHELAVARQEPASAEANRLLHALRGHDSSAVLIEVCQFLERQQALFSVEKDLSVERALGYLSVIAQEGIE